MVIDLEALMNGGERLRVLDCTFDFSDRAPSETASFASFVRVRGEITNTAGVVTLDATAAFTLSFDCDRCAAQVERELSVPMQHTLLRELSNDADWEDYIVVPDFQLDLEALTSEDVLLSIPSKLLCRSDCKGLCPRCGANLNDGACGCKKEIDPRLEGLLSLLDE